MNSARTLEETLTMSLKTLAAAILAVGALLATATPSLASEPIDSFVTTSSSTQAGGHPDLETSFTLHGPGTPEAAQNVIFNAPEGIFGNPNAITRCSSSEFALDECPASSQAGLITLHANYEGEADKLLGTAPLFSVVPGAEETARFAFVVPTLGIPVTISVNVRTGGDYGLRFTVQDITQLTPLASAKLTFWGFPAAEGHDPERFPRGSLSNPQGCVGSESTNCIALPTPAAITVHPLTDNPTTCSGEELITELAVETYQDPSHPSHAESTYPAITGCEKETFNPVLKASPTTQETDSPSGLNLDLKAPQFEGFAASPSEVREATVVLPDGFTINPDAADGQTACLDSQANFDSEGPADCPDNSKIGTFAIGTPALDGPLLGSVFFGEPKPGDQYRLFLVASGFGINAKLIGSVHPEPATGRLTAHFENLPQVPFDDFQLHLFASDRGLMATPAFCRVYTTEAEFVPWDGVLARQHSAQSFGLNTGPHGSSCPGEKRPFSPSLVAGTSNPVAGAHSSFVLKLNREDGDQFLGKLNFEMPPGLTADLRGVTYCPEASIAAAAAKLGREEQASPSCPASSGIGTSNVAAGPGSHPFHAIGKIYMAGPFKGAPLSLVALTPALAGPYDYGVVVVRVALNIDKNDAHVLADSEVVPSIIGGVPIRMRSIQVNIDKPNFMINPTNCSNFVVASQGIGDQGMVADFSSPFVAANCSTLPFKPRMSIRRLGGRQGTSRAQNPRLSFDLKTRAGDANIKSVGVVLPKALEIDQRHLGSICSEKELAANGCAGHPAIGTAITETPLLDQPLQGSVYAVSGSGGLPRLAFLLNGQVPLMPRADTDTVSGGKLRTVVPVVPDAPIGNFRLTVYGGKAGYLINTRSLCAKPAVTQVSFVGQNGIKRTENVKIQSGCAKPKSHRRK
jgi:hypothetical protein